MVIDPMDVIEETIYKFGDKVAVACSFGKNSIVALHMARKINPDIRVVFCNTRCQFVETYKYRDYIKKLWGINLTEVFPKKGVTFWTLVEKYGLPGRKGDSKHKGNNNLQCCTELKELPAMKYYKENDIKAIITGLSMHESHQRFMLAKRYDNKAKIVDNIKTCGQRYFAKSTKQWKIHPIMRWTDDEVFQYYIDNDIPLNEVYTKWDGLYKRSGCLICTAYKSWEEKLSVSHPKLYQYIKLKQSEIDGPDILKNEDLIW